jgi:hypothetical protein
MFAMGLSQGPPHHYWYVWLDRLIPWKDLRAVGLKIVLDKVTVFSFVKLRNVGLGR